MPFLQIEHPPFHLALTLTMGQALRWRMEGNGWISGVINDKIIRLRQVKDSVEFHTSNPSPSDKRFLYHYLRLGQDIHSVHENLAHQAPEIKPLVQLYGGIRILRQDSWECAVTYVCSPRGEVSRIARTVENLADCFGESRYLDGLKRNTFPSDKRLSEVSTNKLRGLMLVKKDHATSVSNLAVQVTKGRLDLNGLCQKTYVQSRDSLVRVRGIGDKVANCILLFSADMPTAFPLDTNILNALKTVCKGQLKNVPKGWEERPYSKLEGNEVVQLRASAQEHFGDHAGYASQLLFHGIRDGAIKP